MLTLKEAAERLGTTPTALQSWADDGHIWLETVKGKQYISEESLRYFVDNVENTYVYGNSRVTLR